MIPRPIKRAVRRVMEATWALQGKWDSRHISKRWPPFNAYTTSLAEVNYDRLRPAYREYVQHISTSSKAVSLEAGGFIYLLATIIKPTRILDLGSGFSSYVLRSYAIDAGRQVTVVSVDDHGYWLLRTEQFLTAQGVATEYMYDWDTFRRQHRPPFDLIFHDMGNMDLRAESLPFILDQLSRDGVIILDDTDKVPYHFIAARETRRAGLRSYSARQFTVDQFLRFSHVAFRKN